MPRLYAANDGGVRFNRESWVRYYPIVNKWLNHYPQPLNIRPVSYSPQTISARIRDAVRGYYTFDWSPNEIDKTRLVEIWEDTVVTVTENEVQFRSKSAADKCVEIEDSLDYLFTITSPDRKELIACAMLANNERFNNRKVCLDNLSADLVLFITSNEFVKAFPNVIIQAKSERTYILL
tara:strand:+ start:1434 stop:1970 length:537 start_codon:yes stop_codon:yes gene_type:complete